MTTVGTQDPPQTIRVNRKMIGIPLEGVEHVLKETCQRNIATRAHGRSLGRVRQIVEGISFPGDLIL